MQIQNIKSANRVKFFYPQFIHNHPNTLNCQSFGDNRILFFLGDILWWGMEKNRTPIIKKMWHKGKFTYICTDCGCIFISYRPWYQALCYSCAGENLWFFLKGDWVAKLHPDLWKKLSLLERKKILKHKWGNSQKFYTYSFKNYFARRLKNLLKISLLTFLGWLWCQEGEVNMDFWLHKGRMKMRLCVELRWKFKVRRYPYMNSTGTIDSNLRVQSKPAGRGAKPPRQRVSTIDPFPAIRPMPPAILFFKHFSGQNNLVFGV